MTSVLVCFGLIFLILLSLYQMDQGIVCWCERQCFLLYMLLAVFSVTACSRTTICLNTSLDSSYSTVLW
uniref:Uncharacterized protein n=1 Tax=Rhizophora mucronata TaxID=61149 RepID=A0A2P2PPF1_RHIMU